MDPTEDHYEETWSEFQPRDPEITALSQQLAARGLLLSEIEEIIKQTLRDKLSQLKADECGYDESCISVLAGLPPARRRRH